MKKLIIFDLDGTIIDSSPGVFRCFNIGLRSCGFPQATADDLHKVIGPPLLYSYMNYFNLSESDAKRAVEAYRGEYKSGGLTEAEVYDGMIDTLAALKKQGYIMCVATTKPELFAKIIGVNLEFSHYFDFICGTRPEDQNHEKDDLIARCLMLTDTQPEDAVMVGDREFDMLAAKKLGLTAVGAIYGFGSREELLSSGCDHLIDSPYEMLETINSME